MFHVVEMLRSVNICACMILRVATGHIVVPVARAPALCTPSVLDLETLQASFLFQPRPLRLIRVDAASLTSVISVKPAPT